MTLFTFRKSNLRQYYIDLSIFQATWAVLTLLLVFLFQVSRDIVVGLVFSKKKKNTRDFWGKNQVQLWIFGALTDPEQDLMTIIWKVNQERDVNFKSHLKLVRPVNIF